MYEHDVKKVICLNNVGVLVKKLTYSEERDLTDLEITSIDYDCDSCVRIIAFDPEKGAPVFKRITGRDDSSNLYALVSLQRTPREPPTYKEMRYSSALYKLVGMGLAKIDDLESIKIRKSQVCG